MPGQDSTSAGDPPRRTGLSGTEAARTPCVRLCRMDPASGLCRGCLRSLDEIVAWRMLNDAEREEIMAALPARRFRLSPEPPAV